MSRPRVLVTRDAGGCSRWSARLAELGAEPVSLPCLEHAVMPESELELRRALTTARWLVVTSARGVDAVAELLGGSGPVRTGEFLPPGVSVAAVGPTTASQALRVLGRVDLVPPTPNASTLAEALWSTADADLGPVVVATADRGRRDLQTILSPRGVDVRRVAVYRTLPAAASARRRALATDRLDAVLLASPSALEGLLAQVEVPADLPIVTLGPTTSSAVRDAGLRVAAEAQQPSLDALYEAFRGLPAVAS